MNGVLRGGRYGLESMRCSSRYSSVMTWTSYRGFRTVNGVFRGGGVLANRAVRERCGYRLNDSRGQTYKHIGFRTVNGVVLRGGEARTTLTQRNGWKSAYRYGYRAVGASYSGGGIGFR